MKNASGPLLALLATGSFVKCDLWTITLSGGVVIRWTSHDTDISYGGNTFTKGPIIDRGQITEKTGVDVSTLEMSITAVYDDYINGVPLIQFISRHGFDGANVKLERAYAADWSTPIIGSIIKFAGKVTSVPSVLGGTAQIIVSSWTILLNAGSPRNFFQSGCLRTLYDAGCALIPSSFSGSGTATAGGAGQRSSFSSGLTGSVNYYSQGRVVFLTGANAGVSKTIKSYDGSGNFTLVSSLPYPVAAGDTFTAYAGCDLAMGTCLSKFNNLGRFKGTPFVPLPTTALGAPTTTTTTGGKG